MYLLYLLYLLYELYLSFGFGPIKPLIVSVMSAEFLGDSVKDLRGITGTHKKPKVHHSTGFHYVLKPCLNSKKKNYN